MQQVGFDVPDWTAPTIPWGEEMPGRFATLVKLEPHHAGPLFAAFAEGGPDLWTYLPTGPMEEEAFRGWIDKACNSTDPFYYTVIDHSTDRPAGLVSFLRIEPDVGSIEVGNIIFAPSIQRTPVTTEAMFLMMEWAFTVGYRRYEWKCDSLNVPSRRAAQRLGFSYEGVFRQARVYKGRNRDTAWFATIDKEWPALKQAFLTWFAPANFDQDGRQIQRLGDLTAPVRVASDPTV
ncbi:GNAT family N-acetyltransferase [Falsirhodobacter sp. alg1]|uniref:GNAT family N-acetyltransferase n=1 Tax=Falsirhodobacter sp. alg1 TaxID=1472418 RepID=UPI0005F006E1|nr:GNAT family protein [Falsirhodobacter sp. alg1]